MPGDSGNRSSTSNTLRAITAETAQYNQDDQLSSKGSNTYSYDTNGRLSQKTTPQGITTYHYGTRGELLSAQTPDALVEYLHNPLGQRIAKKVDGITVEQYHGLNLTTLLATYDANGNVLQRYEYAGGRTPTKLTQGTQTYYILSDYQGTPKLVTDTTGAVVKELSYDSFGNVIQDSNPTFRLPFGYAGGLYDPETQLIRFGYRDYDPDIGRWTARDPIGFGGGSYNLYSYVQNNPLNFVDSLGLWTDPVANSQLRGWYGNSWAPSGSGFGLVRSNGTKYHQGLDLYAPVGTSAVASLNGEVVLVGTHSQFGDQVIIKVEMDGNTKYIRYAHLSSTNVSKGDSVCEGQLVGGAGKTGNASNLANREAHLHFEIMNSMNPGMGATGNSNRMDPANFINLITPSQTTQQ